MNNAKSPKPAKPAATKPVAAPQPQAPKLATPASPTPAISAPEDIQGRTRINASRGGPPSSSGGAGDIGETSMIGSRRRTTAMGAPPTFDPVTGAPISAVPSHDSSKDVEELKKQLQQKESHIRSLMVTQNFHLFFYFFFIFSKFFF